MFPLRKARTLLGLLIGFAIACLVAWLGYERSLDSGLQAASLERQRRLLLFERTLDANIERFRFLPSTMGQASEVREVLMAPHDERVRLNANVFLSNLNSNASTDELFVMDLSGQAIAASNWWSRQTLVGGDFEVRPYFREAVLNGNAQYYAMGLVTHVAGYFLAERIDGRDGPMGVAVTKVNMGEIEAVWWRSGELIAIVDQNDVVTLSTRPDWRYRSITPLSGAEIANVSDDLRYGSLEVDPQGITDAIEEWRGQLRARIESSDPETDGDFLVSELRMPLHGWTLYSFTSLSSIIASARLGAAVWGLGASGLMLAATLFFQRRRLARARTINQRRLEERVAQRTREWRMANERLQAEIAERRVAEEQRRAVEEKLVQAGKLASLGQALAGVAHEVSQPLAALKTQTSSAKLLARNGRRDLLDVLGSMDEVIARLSDLTGHLRSFARPTVPIAISNDVLHVLDNAMLLLSHLVSEGRLRIAIDAPEEDILVIGNPIHIEQVLVNLLSNAADSMENLPEPIARVTIAKSGKWAKISVSDAGQGVDPDIAATLFEPFVSTKPPGRGLGLGLSISYGLVRDMGGHLEYGRCPDGGAVFTVSLLLSAS